MVDFLYTVRTTLDLVADADLPPVFMKGRLYRNGPFISKSIIEAYIGRIWGENSPDGRGATFCFTLLLTG